ncbi:MAG: GNAT family N-acetyltransferase [Candidatus Dormibacteraceae bacterium]
MKDAPYAFGSTWESEKDFTEQDWRKAVESRTRFVAEIHGHIAGMAAASGSAFSRGASLTSLWVAPGSRGRGVGDSLVAAVFGWASDGGFDQIFLWVADGNLHAERLYERHGFRRTGQAQKVRPGQKRLEFEMSVRPDQL